LATFGLTAGRRASPPDADHLLNVLCSLPRWIDSWYFFGWWTRLPVRDLSQPSHWPSRTQYRSASTTQLFEVCSSFTRVTARWFAHPPLLWAWSEGFDAVRYRSTPLLSYSGIPTSSWGGTCTGLVRTRWCSAL